MRSAIIAGLMRARAKNAGPHPAALVVFTMDSARLIDLSGYGYAEVLANCASTGALLIDKYLAFAGFAARYRADCFDARHPLKESDQQMLTFCAAISIRRVSLPDHQGRLNLPSAKARKPRDGKTDHRDQRTRLKAQLFRRARNWRRGSAQTARFLWLGIEL
jgi:hypothetical protein